MVNYCEHLEGTLSVNPTQLGSRARRVAGPLSLPM
jgi:hypothetical protein